MTSSPEKLILRAREDYGHYYLSINEGYKYVAYQQQLIIPALQEIESGDNDRLMILMHPGAAKSRLCTAGFAPWVFGRRPDREIVLVSYGDIPAAKFGRMIRDYLNSGLHKTIFPWCTLRGATQATSDFQTTQGGEIHCAGWGGAIAANRADLLIIDDPHKSFEEAASESIMEDRWQMYSTVVTDRLKPHGKIILCTNRWGPRDLVGRILEKEAKYWKVITLPAEPGQADATYKYLEPGTRYLWQNFFGLQKYELKKNDQWAWETTYQQRPERALPVRFELDWIKHYEDRINPGKFHTGMIVDPALAKHKLADRTCVMVFGGGANEKIFLVDCILDRLDPAERTRAVIKLADKWEVDWILWEEVGMSSDTFYLDREVEAFGLNCPVIPVGRRGPRHNWSKHQRIMQLIPDFKEGRIVLPNELLYKQRDGIVVDLMEYFLKQEYLPYAGAGSIPHDEMLDTFSRIHEEQFVLQFDEGTPQPDTEEKREDGQGQFEGLATGRGSWFSRL